MLQALHKGLRVRFVSPVNSYFIVIVNAVQVLLPSGRPTHPFPSLSMGCCRKGSLLPPSRYRFSVILSAESHSRKEVPFPAAGRSQILPLVGIPAPEMQAPDNRLSIIVLVPMSYPPLRYDFCWPSAGVVRVSPSPHRKHLST